MSNAIFTITLYDLGLGEFRSVIIGPIDGGEHTIAVEFIAVVAGMETPIDDIDGQVSMSVIVKPKGFTGSFQQESGFFTSVVTTGGVTRSAAVCRVEERGAMIEIRATDVGFNYVAGARNCIIRGSLSPR